MTNEMQQTIKCGVNVAICYMPAIVKIVGGIEVWK